MTVSVEEKVIREALAVQDACNLVAVAITFANVVQALSSSGLDTMQVREHPASVLFADKIASLCGVQSLGNSKFSLAYKCSCMFVEALDRLTICD